MVEQPLCTNDEPNEEDPEILALETKLRAMREARCSKDSSRGLAVSRLVCISTIILKTLLLPKRAEITFHDDIFTPDIDMRDVADVEIIDDEVPPSSASATKISSGLKRKAATEAAKSERSASSPHHTSSLTYQTPRVKRAKDIELARMKPTMPKPSGKRPGHNLPTTVTHTKATTVVTPDEDETDHDYEEESEDIKPAAGSLMRSSSVCHFESILELADTV